MAQTLVFKPKTAILSHLIRKADDGTRTHNARAISIDFMRFLKSMDKLWTKNFMSKG